MKWTPMTRWERLLWRLNIASRRQVTEDFETLFAERDRKITLLYRALLSIKLDDEKSRQRVNSLLTGREFTDELNEIPMFPYGNDSSRPK